MHAHRTIDEIYDQFTRTLNPSEQPFARGLAHTIGLAPSDDVPWSRVFCQEVVRALPIFVAEAMPRACRGLIDDAVTAHALGIITAFAVDRIQDGQIGRPSRAVLKVVNELRRARDSALDRLGPGSCDPFFDYGIGEWELTAIAVEEQRLLGDRAPADLATYERIAVEKQHAAFPAAMRLAVAAGSSAEQLALVRSSITGIALAFQMVDDVFDWQDDLARGGAWPAALTLSAGDDPRDIDEMRRRVLSSGILSRLLSSAAGALNDVSVAAEALGAKRLAQWAEWEARTFLVFAERERVSPGLAARSHEERRRANGAVATNPTEHQATAALD
jgi:hypothetical protein